MSVVRATLLTCFASKLSSRLNTHPGLSADELHSFNTSLLEYQLSEVKVSTDDVLSAIESLKPGKTDSDHVSSYHLKYAVPVHCFLLYGYPSPWLYAQIFP